MGAEAEESGCFSHSKRRMEQATIHLEKEECTSSSLEDEDYVEEDYVSKTMKMMTLPYKVELKDDDK